MGWLGLHLVELQREDEGGLPTACCCPQVNLDDCMVEVKRDASGKLVPDQSRFPSGFKSLSDYIHSKGLKFGVYTGQLPCRWLVLASRALSTGVTLA